MKSLSYISIVFALVNLLSACSLAPRKPVFSEEATAVKGALVVMTYNVENLFDTVDDPEKDDETYLPIEMKKTGAIKAKCQLAEKSWWVKSCLNKDWDEGALKTKMQRLAHVLKSVKGGQGPDILILQEVENRQVLEVWRKEFLVGMGYKPAVLVEGLDKRGIDVAVMTRLKVVPPLKLHQLKFVPNENLKAEQIRPTRGILETTVRLPGNQLLTILGAHFPSQGAPTETRRQALLALNKIQASLPKKRMVIAGGDFNITSSEDAEKQYFAKIASKNWGVSHMMGCEGCQGTNYYHYKRQWSFFDVLLFSKNMLKGGSAPWKLVPNTIRIENNSKYQINNWGNPARFNNNRKDGVSDHWPMAAEIARVRRGKAKKKKTVIR